MLPAQRSLTVGVAAGRPFALPDARRLLCTRLRAALAAAPGRHGGAAGREHGPSWAVAVVLLRRGERPAFVQLLGGNFDSNAVQISIPPKSLNGFQGEDEKLMAILR